MPSFSLSSMMPVEELFPMLVAGHVVVGDEERRDALPVVLADDRLEIVGVAEPALAALHVDDGAERALERAAAAEIEARLLALVAGQRGGRQMRRRRVLDARQIVHVVVERLQRAVPGIAQHLVEPAFLGLAGIDRDAHVHGFLDLGRHDRQHRQAAGGMEAAHRHRQAGLEELAGEVDGVRELVGLHADQADQALAARRARSRAMMRSARTRVLVSSIGLMTMSTSGPSTAPLAAVLAQAIERGEGIGRDVGAQPGDRIAVVVVVRRLDQHQLEGLLHCPAHYGFSPPIRVRHAFRPRDGLLSAKSYHERGERARLYDYIQGNEYLRSGNVNRPSAHSPALAAISA